MVDPSSLPKKPFDSELSLVQMWIDGEVEFDDLPEEVRDALTEVFSEEVEDAPEPMVVDVPPVVDLVKSEPVQHLDLLHKANDEHRFTLGPWYIPNRYDAHGEWTDASELQKALWDYVKGGDRDIRLQHNKDIVAGEWLEAMSFPVPVTIGMKKSTSEQQVVYPAGTVFLGVQWKPWAWDMVKAGKIRGFSIGGAAARIEMQMPEEINKASFGSRSEAGRYAANVRWQSVVQQRVMAGAQIKAKMKTDSEKPKDGKPNIAQRIKDYFTTLPEGYNVASDRRLNEARDKNENLVDRKTSEVINLPSGRSAIIQGGKITTTKFPKEGIVASPSRPLRSPKSTSVPTGKKPKNWLQSGYGSAPKIKRSVTSVDKSEDLAKSRVKLQIRTVHAMKKENPTSSAVHVDAIMGSKGKKKKRVKPSLQDVELIEKTKSAAWQRAEGKNPKGGLNAKGRASYKRETGGTLRPPVKRGDNPRRASFLARMGNMAGAERDANGEPTRLLLSLQAWGANSKEEARKKAKAISARNEKKMNKASFGGDRSEAGRYAANIRWMRSHINSMGKEFGVGEFGQAKTAEGKILEDLMPSLATHCNMDALATSVRERNLVGKDIGNFLDNLDAPKIVYQFLSAERKWVWNDAISDAVRGVPQGKNPDGSVVYLKAGGGGAGKSSTPDIEGVTLPHYGSTLNGNPEKEGKNFPREAVMSNADDVKEILPAWSQSEKHSKTKSETVEIKGKDTVILRGTAMDKRAAFVHEESSMIASLIVTQAIQAGQDLIVDGTLDNGVAKSLGKMASYRDNGASKVNLIVYTCDTDEAETRSHKRSVETGRNVPVDHLRKAHIKVSANFPTYLEKGNLDSVTIIDTNRNTDGSKRPSEKIFEFKPSGGIKILNQALYDRFIDKRNDSVQSTLDREDIVEEYKASGGQ